MSKEKYSVTVYRFIRPGNSLWDEDFENILHDNLSGITVRFDIDYVARTVTAGWTICDGVNFYKGEGKSRADNAYVKEEFDYIQVDIHKGLVNALIESLNLKYSKYAVDIKHSYPSFEDKLRLFRRALREDI